MKSAKNKIKVLIISSIFIIIIIFLMTGCSNIKKQEPQITNNKNQAKQTYTNNPSVLSVVRNMEAPVPEELEMPRATIIGKYLYECSILTGKEKINCYDEYYRNNYKELYEKRAECTQNEEECMNEYYLLASAFAGKMYCEAITSNEMKEECLLESE